MTTTKTTTKTKFRLTIHHDELSYDLNPNNEDLPLFKLHSFNNHHVDFTDPNYLLACQYEYPEGHEYEGDPCDELPIEHGSEEDEISDHEWVGPEGWFLSYFEHTTCRWGLQGTMSGMPDFRWDGTEFAGFLEVTVPDDEREWWDGRPEEDRREAAESFVQEYTDWANGEVYGYEIEELEPTKTCDLGYEHEQIGEVDSCFGFIGFDNIQDEVRGITYTMGATENNTEIVDKAYGIAEYGRWFVTEDEGKEIDERLAKNRERMGV